MTKRLRIDNARVLDGTGAPPKDGVSILVEDGWIRRMGPAIPSDDAEILDVVGATVMPGLIDAHVHLESVPGSYYRGDSDERLWEFRRQQLRAYPACGVTTVLDCGISARQLEQFRDHLSAGGVGPRIFALAPIFYPPGGYGDAVEMPQWGPFRSSGSAEDVESLFEEYAAFDNVIGAKMTLEPGVGPSRVWPIHSPQMRKIIAEAAERRGLPIYTHALKVKEQWIALEMGVYCLAHAGFFRDDPSEAFIEELKRRHVYVTTTLASTVAQNLVMFDLKQLDDPLLESVVPRGQLETARNPEAWKSTMFEMFKISSPSWMPEFVIRLMLKAVNLEKELGDQLERSSRAIRAMHEAGVPIVVGTDSANWPLFLNNFHGSSLILELELLQRAGLAPMEILVAATRRAAEMMRIQDELGTVEEGKRADLLVVSGDPLEDVRALKEISWSIQGGVARTPRQWMEN